MVPEPAFVIPKPVPLIMPLIVKSVAEVPSVATVMVRVAPKATGQPIVAPAVPPPLSVTVISPPKVIAPVPVIEAPVLRPPHSKETAGMAVVPPNVNVDNANVAPAFTVKEPVEAIELRATLKVVVPDDSIKSLNEVKMVEGNVLVAAISTVPVPGVQTLDEKAVNAPLTFKYPPAVMVNVLAWAATAPKDKLPHSRVEPLVKVIAPFLLALPELPITTAPDTTSLGLPDPAKVKVAVPFPVPKDNDAHVAEVTLTVTVIPTLIVTASVDVGTEDPPQVAVSFQLPVTEAVLCAKVLATKNKHMIMNSVAVFLEL